MASHFLNVCEAKHSTAFKAAVHDYADGMLEDNSVQSFEKLIMDSRPSW